MGSIFISFLCSLLLQFADPILQFVQISYLPRGARCLLNDVRKALESIIKGR